MAKFSVFLISLFFSSLSFAGAPQATHVRLYGGGQTIKPQVLNEELVARGIDEYKTITMYGMEVGYRIVPLINLGIRYVGKTGLVKETTSTNPTNPYLSSMQTQQFFGTLRLNLIDGNHFFFDAFGGAGIGSMKLETRTAAGEGAYEQGNSAFVSTAGASFGFGWSNVFLFFEGGQEWGVFDNLTRSGTTTAVIDKVDMSGSYFMIGLNFRGVPGFVNLKGSSSSK